MPKECIGCGQDVPGPENENQSGEWCIFGECPITDFDGVNRLREAFQNSQKKADGEIRAGGQP